MPDVLTAEAYRHLLVNDTPMIDVRAPVEFAKGSLPGAVNIPLLNDRERAAVGTRYRRSGQDEAIRLGQELVSGAAREQRMAQWTTYIDANPGAVIYCYRGGLRSRTVQQWLDQAGIRVARLEGGYKGVRAYLNDTIVRAASEIKLLMVAGKTGCAKTDLVNSLSPSIDLEGLANHRGSAFGRRVSPQPQQASFENALAVNLLRLPWESYKRLVLEDEGRAVGSLSVPVALYQQMGQAPVAIIEESLDFRVETVLHAYIEVNYSDFRTADPETADQEFAEYLRASLHKIQRRLGKELFVEIQADLEHALNRHLQDEQAIDAHRTWIEKLLRLYYDPMYEYQLEKKLHRIVFRGTSAEFRRWVATLQFAGSGTE